MRGLERLTSLAENALQDIDKIAGDAADRILAARDRAATAVDGFHSLAETMEEKAVLVEQALAQLTNKPPASPPAPAPAAPPQPTAAPSTPLPPPPTLAPPPSAQPAAVPSAAVPAPVPLT